MLAEIEIEELPEMILSSECGISTAGTLPVVFVHLQMLFELFALLYSHL